MRDNLYDGVYMEHEPVDVHKARKENIESNNLQRNKKGTAASSESSNS